MVKFTPKHLNSNVNISHEHPLKEFFVLTVGLLLIILFTYLSLGFALEQIILRYSDRLETYLVKMVSVPKFEISPELDDATKAVQAVLDKLVLKMESSPYDFNVRVVDSEQVNALALPGGNIIVFKGLLDRLESENELAMVLAHELGHYENKDHLRGLGRGVVLAFISASVFGQNAALSDMLIGTLSSVDMKFSRNQESAADQFGLDLLNQTYGHVGGAGEMFRKLEESRELPKFMSYLSTHPLGEDRIKHINAIAGQKGYKIMEQKNLEPAIHAYENNDK